MSEQLPNEKQVREAVAWTLNFHPFDILSSDNIKGIETLRTLAEAWLKAVKDMPEKDEQGVHSSDPITRTLTKARNSLIDACTLAHAKAMAELLQELANLKAYVGNEMYMSDFKTASDMRKNLEYYREENAKLKAIADRVTVENIEKVINSFYTHRVGIAEAIVKAIKGDVKHG